MPSRKARSASGPAARACSMAAAVCCSAVWACARAGRNCSRTAMSRVICVRQERRPCMRDMTRYGDSFVRRMASSVGQSLMFFIAMCAAGHAQNWLAPMENFAPAGSPLSLQQHVEPEKPFTVAGECGAFVGQQDGQFEAWLFPVKILSHMQIEARMEGYDVPIDVTRHAAEIDVEPDHTTITYSHVAFTLRETFFATQCEPQDLAKASIGAMAVFTLDSIRPTTLTFNFTPEVKPMWPAPQLGQTDAEWIPLNPHAADAL